MTIYFPVTVKNDANESGSIEFSYLEIGNLSCNALATLLAFVIFIVLKKRKANHLFRFDAFHTFRSILLLILIFVWSLLVAEALIRWFYSTVPLSLFNLLFSISPLCSTITILFLSQILESLLCPFNFIISILLWSFQLCYASAKTYEFLVTVHLKITLVAPSLFISAGLIDSLLILMDVYYLGNISGKRKNSYTITKLPMDRRIGMQKSCIKSCLKSGKRSPDVVTELDKTSIGNNVSFLPTGAEDTTNTSDDVFEVLADASIDSEEDYDNLEENGLCYCHQESSFLSKITFAWYIDILKVGWKKPLEFSDFGSLSEKESSQYHHDIIIETYNKIRNDSGKPPSLRNVLWNCHWRQLIVGGVLKLFGDAANVVGPLVIAPIVHFVRSVQDGSRDVIGQVAHEKFYIDWYGFLSNGWVIAWLALVASFLQASFSQASSHILAMEGMHARTALQTLIYTKSLKMTTRTCNPSANENNEVDRDSSILDTAEVINLTSEDSENIMSFFLHCHYIWAIPLKVTALVVILWRQLGISAVYASVATIIVLVPLQFLLAKFIAAINKKFVCVSDDRLRITHEIISFIRSIKANVWDTIFVSKFTDIRNEELDLLLKDSMLRAGMTFLTQASGITIILLAFVFYGILEGEAPDEGVVFSSLALFSQLTVPLFILPLIVAYTIKAQRSSRRIQNFLEKPEVNHWVKEPAPLLCADHRPKSNIESNQFVLDSNADTDEFSRRNGNGIFFRNSILRIHDGEFRVTSDQNSYILLKNINLTIPKGKLTIIIGNVGSGKSSLLLAMLKEIPQSSGKMFSNCDTSAVAYVPQNPWLLNRTVKENITLFKNFNIHKYDRVLSACALKPDIKILPEGDNTDIGEQGINLSGGQRQRLAIARAIYSEIPVIFMDCPFSALDSNVSDQIFQEGILDMLLKKRHASIVITTQHKNFCQYADQVINLENKSIKHQGTPKELSVKYPQMWKEWIKENSVLYSKKNNTIHERKSLRRQVSRISFQYSATETSNTAKNTLFDESFESLFIRSHRRKQSLVRNVPLHSVVTADEMESLHAVATFSRRKKIYHRPTLVAARTKSSAPAFGRSEDEVLLREPSSLNRRNARSLPLRRSRIPSNPNENKNLNQIRRNSSLLWKFFPSKSFISKKNGGSSYRWSIKRFLSNEETFKEESKELEENEASIDLYEAIIDEEERERGRISKWNYITYLKACGWAIGVAYLIFSFINQGLTILLDLWLGLWSSEETRLQIGNHSLILCNSTFLKNYITSSIEFNPCSFENQVHYYLSIFAILSGVTVVVGLITICLAQVGAHRGRRELHQQLLLSVINSKIKFFDVTPMGRIINRFSSDTSMIDKELGWALMHLVYFSLLCGSAIIVNVAISPIFIVVTIPICLTYYLVQHIYRCTSRELKRLESLSRSPLFGIISETVSNPAVIRAYKMQDRFKNYFFRTLNSYLCPSTLLHSGNRWIGISLDYIGGFVVFLSTVACLFGSMISSTKMLQPATVGIAIRYTLAIPVYLNWLVRFLSDTEMCLNSVERVRQYTHLPEEHDEDPCSLAETCKPIRKLRSLRSKAVQRSHSFVFRGVSVPRSRDESQPGFVQFKNVQLFYDFAKDPVVSNINFTILNGEKVAICGRTGSGKSSLLLGILRMVEGQEGEILVDGMNILQIPLKKLRKSISFVMQEDGLFTGTFRFNLDPMNIHNDSDIWDVLGHVLMKDFVASTSQTLDSKIGQGYNTLSSGQTQLLMIARVILDRKKLILLDEISAHLDPMTEQHIISMLKIELPRSTIISVAHSRMTLMESDRVFVMQEGKMVEDGFPSELLRIKNSKFNSLLQSINKSL